MMVARSRLTGLACAAMVGSLVSPGQHHGSVPAPPVADVRTATATPLAGELFGFNTNNTGDAYTYASPVYAVNVAVLHTRVLRFPGGTVANFYHWQTGTFDPSAATNAALPHQQQEHGSRGLAAAHASFDEFMALAQRSGVEPVIVVNVYTGSPAESAAWVHYARQRGYRIYGWELGNEMYLPAYRDKYRRPVFYAEEARAHAMAMKAVDPGIRISVPVSPLGFHPGEPDSFYEEKWNEAIAANRFYDAYSVHLYTFPPEWRPGAGFGSMADALFASSDAALDSAMRYYGSRFASLPMWVTEWNVKDARSAIDNTALHALFIGDFFIGLLQHQDQVRLAAYHLFAGAGKGYPLISPATEGDPGEQDVRRTPYYAFALIGEALSEATTRMDVRLSNVPDAGSEGSGVAAIRAVAVRGSGATMLLLSNRRSSPQKLSLSRDGQPYSGRVQLRYVGGAELAATNGGNAILPGNGHAGVTIHEWTGDASALVLPAYAFCVVTLP